MIHFTYVHVTRNQNFESYIRKQLSELLGDECRGCHVQVKLYRVFNKRNVAKETLDLDATINGVMYKTSAKMSTFKSSFNRAYKQLQLEVESAAGNQQSDMGTTLSKSA